MPTPFSSLCDFIGREVDGTAMDDPAYRAYDLDRKQAGAGIDRALWHLNAINIDDLRHKLQTIGVTTDDLTGRVARWYVWWRLDRGVLVRWPLRSERARPRKP